MIRELTEHDIEEAKALMWDRGLTKKEAYCLVQYGHGVSAREIARDEGTSENLIFHRLASARRKQGTSL